MEMITNICANIELACVFDLNKLLIENVELFTSKKYNAKVFSALIAKYNNTKITLLIFYNGKIVLTGAKREEDIINCTIELSNYFNAGIKKLEYTNYCISLDINKRINLNKLATDYKNCSFEQELFPGAKFKLNDIVYTVHYNGKIFATGFKSRENTEKVKEVLSVLEKYS